MWPADCQLYHADLRYSTCYNSRGRIQEHHSSWYKADFFKTLHNFMCNERMIRVQIMFIENRLLFVCILIAGCTACVRNVLGSFNVRAVVDSLTFLKWNDIWTFLRLWDVANYWGIAHTWCHSCSSKSTVELSSGCCTFGWILYWQHESSSSMTCRGSVCMSEY
jgi:hypothetical protein